MHEETREWKEAGTMGWLAQGEGVTRQKDRRTVEVHQEVIAHLSKEVQEDS